MIEINQMQLITSAINRLCPGAQYSVINDTLETNSDGKLASVRWNEGNSYDEPLAKDIIEQMAIVRHEWEQCQYQRLRSVEYPNLADQLDMLWHAIDENKLDTTSDFYQSLKAVKDKYPKDS
jgi:hypothetical protein